MQRRPSTDLEWAQFIKIWEQNYRLGRFGTIQSVDTPAFTGFSANPTILKYKSVDGIVTIWGNTGTSNATGYTFTVPAEIRPNSTTSVICVATDNAVIILARASIATTGVVTMSTAVATGTPVTFNTTGWTGSSTKGLSGPIIYSLEGLV